jgi:hypothetical protein
LTGYIACEILEGMRNYCKFLVGKFPKEERTWKTQFVSERILLRPIVST